jgi:hypothetical protein
MKKSILLFRIAILFLTSANFLSAQYPNDPFQFPIQFTETYVTPGTLWGDYDHDGYVDIFFSNGTQNYLWPNDLYKNNGNETFTRQSGAGSIVTDTYTHGGGSWGDYDNDGDLDLIIGDPFTNASGGNHSQVRLYRNNNDGTFTSVTTYPLTQEATISKIGAAWADFNNDGYLDVTVSNANFQGIAQKYTMYVNNQDGTFSSVSNNITNNAYSARSGFSWADFDDDGDQDLVTCSGAPGQNTTLWMNTGSNWTSYVLIASGSGVGKDTQGASWGDYDNDGDLDVFVANWGDQGASAPEQNFLFRNDGKDGAGAPIFTRLDASSGIGEIVTDTDYSGAAGWADLDNDGDLDLFVGNDGGYAAGYRSRVYLNDGDGTFTRLNNTIVADSATFSRGAAWGDFNNDGFMDILVGRDGKNRLFENNGNSSHWIEINLVGTTANRSAIGAIVRLSATISGQSVSMMRDVSGQTGYGGQGSMRVHFGLGDASVIQSITIHWPGSGSSNTYNNVAVDQIVTYTEGAAANNPPVATDDAASTDEDTPVTVAVLTNDTDPDSDPLQVSEVTQGAHGGVVINVNNTVTYSPELNYNGEDQFTYTVSDGNGGTDVGTVTVSINAVNDAPVIVNLPALVTVEVTKSVKLDMALYESDVDTPVGSLSWSFEVSSPLISYSYNAADDTLTITAGSTEGDYELYCTLTDDYDATDMDTITVRVEPASAIENTLNGIPHKFEVLQNYPNPFNPTTTIYYGIAQPSDVLVEVYDLSGQQIFSARFDHMPAGYHQLSFDGNGKASGLYLYRIQAGPFQEIRKMILLK